VTDILRVATWNIHEGVPIDPPPLSDQYDDVTGTLAKARVQVAALQEVRFDEGSRADGLMRIGSEISLPYVLSFPMSPSAYGKGGNMGIALLSYYPLAEVTREVLPNPGILHAQGDGILESHEKGLLAAHLDWNGPPIVIVSLHTFPFHAFDRHADDSEFEYIWIALASVIDRFEEDPLIVCGDFNTDKRNLLTDRLSRAKLNSAVSKIPTYDGESFDDILYSRHFTLLDTSVIRTFSDHALCVAALRLYG
jgi:endonuclease/exonuclease/phosphatase family metal-dependent hydrolase